MSSLSMGFILHSFWRSMAGGRKCLSIFGSSRSQLHTNVFLTCTQFYVVHNPPFGFILKQGDPGASHKSLQIPSDMIIRLGRLTPGYFRLLQVFLSSPRLGNNIRFSSSGPKISNLTDCLHSAEPSQAPYGSRVGYHPHYIRTCWPLFKVFIGNSCGNRSLF